MFNNCLTLELLNKLDIQEDSFLFLSLKNSFFVRMIGCLFNWIQTIVNPAVKTSKFAEHVDLLILITLSFTIISIIFATTGIIALFIALSFGLLLFKYCCVKGRKHHLTSFDIPVFLYIAIAGISMCFSSLFLPSLKGYIKMLVYLGGYLTFFNIFKGNPKRIIYFMGLLTLTASVEAFYSVYQQITGIEPLAAWQDLNNVNPEQLMNRVYGTLKPYNPNLLAGYLVASFAPALGTSFWFLCKKYWRLSVFSFAGTLAILLSIIFTGSRGAYMAISAMLVTFVLISGHLVHHEFKHIKWLKKLWLACIAFGIISILAGFLISPALNHRILSIFALRGDSSNSFRLNVYSACITMFKDNWLIGIGTGNTTFRLIYGIYMITGFDALGAYCVLLEIAVEIGIFGLMAFLWLLLLSYIKSVKYIINNNLLENKIIVSSCVIAIIGMMVHGFVDTIWYRPQVNVLFWMIVAILAVITSNRREISKEFSKQ